MDKEPSVYRRNLNILIIQIVKQGKPYVFRKVGKSREMYNTQRAEDTGKSEGSYVMYEIGIQDLS